MSDFSGEAQYTPRVEKVNYIVPERIREAVRARARALTYKEAAEKCGMSEYEFGIMANGHVEIPRSCILQLVGGLGMPEEFFYRVKWYIG